MNSREAMSPREFLGPMCADRFQVELAARWENYEATEDGVLKEAYLAGQDEVHFKLHGAPYKVDFRQMLQVNLGTGRRRPIRAPHSWQERPAPGGAGSGGRARQLHLRAEP
ncbi:unnamed protein product [Effrenium voratum]|nr:unnamed protein product [Effrenium voratum]